MGELRDYIIHPQPGISDEEIAKTDATICKIAGPDNTIKQVWATAMRPTYLLFWLGPLTEREADEVRKLDGVEVVNMDGIDPDIEYPRSMKNRE